jgi:hypothetical protein
MTDMQVRPSIHRVSARRPCEPLQIQKTYCFSALLGQFQFCTKRIAHKFPSSDRSDAHLASRDAVLMTPKFARAR